MTTITVYLLLSLALLLLLYLIRQAYPRPYPGIPYLAPSARRLWGDLPHILPVISLTQDPAKYVYSLCRQLNSPVIQLFLRPFSAPIIFVDDVREVKDILGMRTMEFDRAPSTQAVFAPFLPHASIAKRTTPEWRAQRRLWEGVMGRDFLRRVAAPRMLGCARELCELLRVKAEIAGGRPFYVFEDFDLAAFDVIWTVIFGRNLEALVTERKGILEHREDVVLPGSKDELAVFPTLRRPEIYEAVAWFVKGVEKTLRSLSQPWHHWVLRQMPAYRAKWAMKERLVSGLIHDTRSKLADLADDQLDTFEDTCAMDMALRRERLAYDGKFDARPPTTREIHDELFMFLVAVSDFHPSTLHGSGSDQCRATKQKQ